MSETANSETLPPRAVPWWRGVYEVKVWQWIGVLTVITCTVFGGIYSFMLYLRDAEERQCSLAVEARTDVRGVILGVYDAIEADGLNPLVQELRSTLDDTYPQFTFDECMEERFHR